MAKKICKRETPNPFENIRGEQGNVCRDCQGEIVAMQPQPSPPSRDSTTGRCIIALQDAMNRADFRSDQEANEFGQYFCETVHEKLRQGILTWRVNVLDSEG